MKKTIFKRLVCAALAAVMTLPLTACGKKEPPMASKENIFSTTEMELPQSFDNVQSMAVGGEKIFLIGSTYESSGEGENFKWKNQTILSILDMNGNGIKDVVLEETSSEDMESSGTSRNINRMCVDTAGNIFLLVNEYSWNEETMESKEEYYIARYDNDGNPIDEIKLDKLRQEDSEEDYFYISGMAVGDDGSIVICGEKEVYALDNTGKLVFTVKKEEENNDTSGSYLEGVYRTGSGKIVVMQSSWENTNDEYKNTRVARTLDMASKSLTDEYKLNSNWYDYYDGGGDYDLYVSTENSLKGLNLATGEATNIIDWLKSGFDTNTLQNVMVLPDGRLLAVTYKYEASGSGYSWGGDGMILTILTPVDPADVPDKKLITASAFYLDFRLKQRIVEFNKNSLEYQLEVTTYNDYDDGTGDYEAGITKMNNDLIAGNIPDIIVVNDSMPFDSYISKGIIADLNEFIDKDEEINRSDYMENVLNALSVGGKLYRITPSFSINTLAIKSKFADGKQSWTMKDYLDMAAANPDKNMLNYEQTKEGFLSNMLNGSMNSYVNRETGECFFNSDGFKSLLEAANAYPLEINHDEINMDQNYWMERETALREDKALISSEYIYDFRRIKRIEQGDFGEPVTFIGYPCDNGNGTLISPDTQLAITSKAKNPEGAWSFVKYFLSDEYQSTITGSFPMKLSAYDALMEEAKKKPTFTDENGNEVEYDDTYWIGDSEIKIDVNTDEDNQRVMDMLKSANMAPRYDQNLMVIITEEAAAYFSGQKSVDEVAEIIQNRASTYISEGM